MSQTTVATGTEGSTTPPTPRWLIQGDLALCPCGCIGKRKKGSFVEKTIDGASNLMRQAIFGEDVANQAGLLQRIDPRVKIFSMLALLIATAFLRHIPAERLWLNPDCGFWETPRWVVKQKLLALVEGARIVRAEISGRG